MGCNWLVGCRLMFFRDGADVIVKIEDVIIQSLLRWYGHVTRVDSNSQLREVMEVEITRKRIWNDMA